MKAFDNGELKVDLDGVRRMMDELLTVMNNETTFRPADPLVVAFKSIWDRLSEVSASSMSMQSSLIIQSNCSAGKHIVNLWLI